eukprot:607404-Prorocentrum_minimum.AAC.2
MYSNRGSVTGCPRSYERLYTRAIPNVRLHVICIHLPCVALLATQQSVRGGTSEFGVMTAKGEACAAYGVAVRTSRVWALKSRKGETHAKLDEKLDLPHCGLGGTKGPTT